MKKRMKLVIVAVVLVIGAVFAISHIGDDGMKAVSEDGRWEAYAYETTNDEGKAIWQGVVVFKGEEDAKIKNVRTQKCANGIKSKFVKRTLKSTDEEKVKQSNIGGSDQFYFFMKERTKKPNSLSVKVQWTENGEKHIEKMWLI